MAEGDGPVALLRVGGHSPAPLCIMGSRPGALREINERGVAGGVGGGE